jgi:hypothetical protein
MDGAGAGVDLGGWCWPVWIGMARGGDNLGGWRFVIQSLAFETKDVTLAIAGG